MVTPNNILSESPIQKINFSGFEFYIKRDDLLNPFFSGNKARKFAYYLHNTPANIANLISYGSIQANSLLSLSALANIKGWQLYYYVERIPSWLKESSTGNYSQALSLGAKVIERSQLPSNKKYIDENLDTLMHFEAEQLSNNSLFIPEGGRSNYAQLGINVLAKELADYCRLNHWYSKYNTINIMLPSGTGTTALFLQTWFCEQALPVKVLTCPCVGDSHYLEQQFNSLNPNKTQWPTILPTRKKYHFGKLYPEHINQWQILKQQTRIEFDLLYDPTGWESIISYLKGNKQSYTQPVQTQKNQLQEESPIIYIHQGGLVGNQSMLPRYKRKYPHVF